LLNVSSELSSAAPFGDRLGNQQAVEWVLVDRWKCFHTQHVVQRHRQNLQAVGLLLRDDRSQGQFQLEPAELSLDDHLPDVYHAQENGIRRLAEEREDGVGEPRRLAGPPNERVRVEQTVHD